MIKINDITKKYGDTIILENSEYTFPKTGLVCLMGSSGSGKTTLLNLLAGFDNDYDGEIIVNGTSISKMNSDELCRYRKDNIGFVFQNYHLLPGYTVLENVLLSCELIESAPELTRQKAKNLLTRLGIAEKENQKCENLSGGQKQRVAIARSLINDPQILLADEPTGALDRGTSTEIMELLCEISQDRLVVVITHDQKICDFADEIIHIKGKKIIAKQNVIREDNSEKALMSSNPSKVSTFARGLKNFKVHINRYIVMSLAISIGVLAFLFSLSFGNVMEQSIEEFKGKNTAFNNGYIKGADDGTILNHLNSNEKIENVYYQYKLNEITLMLGEKTEIMAEKFPTPKATEGLSYGVMPKQGINEIALSPSLAKKFDSDIKNIVGKDLTLEFNSKRYKLTISGIYNSEYDDFFVSSDVEKQFYDNIKDTDNYSISYDVKKFSDIVGVSNALKLHGLTSKDASDEVYALQNTFDSLNKLFLVISILILGIGIFICAVLLFKLQNSRYHEVGLLSALGFNRHQISSMISAENMLLCTLATVANLTLLGFSILFSNLLDLPLIITEVQIGLSILSTFVVVMILSGVASYNLVHTSPAIALRK
ncbi:ABC transporter ATP-binding protein/permease [Clostridium botulinum]|nr:ABC transporter ATP-binding protein/permease [Clostridium botulinum]